MASNIKAEETASVDLGALLDAGDGAVVTLEAGETRLVAHRAVVAARSPVFEAMFCSDTQEGGSGQVAVSDVEGPVLRQLLAYCYTLQAPQLHSMVPELLAAANKYGASGLKAQCEEQLAAQLAVENAAATAVLAVRHSCPNLTEAAVTFIKAHELQVLATQGWADSMSKHPQDVAEVRRLLAGPQAEKSVLATTDNRPMASTKLPRDRGQPPLKAAPSVAPHRSDQPDVAAVSHMQNISGKEKARRLIQAAKQGAVEELQVLHVAGADMEARDSQRRTALYWSAGRGHAKAVRCLLALGVEVDPRDCDQRTPLHEAAARGHTAVVRLLVEFSADPNAMDKYGWTPLHSAANNGHAETVAVLLKAGADKGVRNADRDTPLDVAIRRKHQQLLYMLSRSVPASPSTSATASTQLQRDHGQTSATAAPAVSPHHTVQPDDAAVSRMRNISGKEKARRLIQAAKQRSVEELHVLHAAGADMEARDSQRRTALYWSAGRGHAKAVGCLLALGVAVDPRDCDQRTPLHEAAARGDTAVVRLLLEFSADPNAMDKYGWTPLHSATYNGHAETVAVLLKAGAEKGVRNADRDTALDIAIHRKHHQLLYMLSPRVPSEKDLVMWLMQAAKEGAEEDLQVLHAAGMDLETRDGGKRTALYWSAARGHDKAVFFLLVCGVGVDPRDCLQYTPLHVASMYGHTAVVQLLVEFSADPNAKDRYGSTPLHYAAYNGHAETAAVLLKAGADKGARNCDRETPLDAATQRNHQQLLNMLSQKQ